jgi:dTDP-4-amino-4,6-dideoxy-D-glucose acyltransferase
LQGKERAVPGLNAAFLSREVLESLGFARLGEDVLIHGTAVIVDCAKVAIGSRVRIDPYVIISAGGGVDLGSNIHIGAHSVMAGGGRVEMADFVTISHFVGIFTSQDDVTGRVMINPTVPPRFKGVRTATIRFGKHAFVGAGSVILPGAVFEEGAGLAAMSRTGRPLKPWSTYAGIPARRLSNRRRDALRLEQEYIATLEKIGP